MGLSQIQKAATILFAATTLQLVPIVLFVIIAQRYLIAGLTAGATKG